jgi:hypothetical protein
MPARPTEASSVGRGLAARATAARDRGEFTASAGKSSRLQSTSNYCSLEKNHCLPYKFLKIHPAKKWTIWGTFGPKFPFFF